jgi:hypothetical protein
VTTALAQQWRYRSRSTAVGYLGGTEPQRAAEATAFIAWRDAVLDYLYQNFAANEAGEAAPSTTEDFISGIGADCLAEPLGRTAADARACAGPPWCRPPTRRRTNRFKKKRARPFFPFEPSTVSWRREHRR